MRFSINMTACAGLQKGLHRVVLLIAQDALLCSKTLNIRLLN